MENKKYPFRHSFVEFWNFQANVYLSCSVILLINDLLTELYFLLFGYSSLVRAAKSYEE